jgi:hypothetical protein
MSHPRIVDPYANGEEIIVSTTTTKDELLARIGAEHEGWRALVTEVGEGRMEQPGPMGEWTFKDMAAHLSGWRERTIRRLEAGPGVEPPMPWPANLDDDDEINDWIHEQNRARPLGDVLTDADASYDRLAAAIAALPEADVTTPGRFAWAEGIALADADFFGHLHEEHEPSLRAWLAS